MKFATGVSASLEDQLTPGVEGEGGGGVHDGGGREGSGGPLKELTGWGRSEITGNYFFLGGGGWLGAGHPPPRPT